MFSTKTRYVLVMAVLAMVLIPLAASWFAYPSTHLPPGFGIFHRSLWRSLLGLT